jgi:hypothetical protein
MGSSFQLTMYLSKLDWFRYGYPQKDIVQHPELQGELGLSKEDYANWTPDHIQLPQFNDKKFLYALTNYDFVKIVESHSCREVAISKGMQLSQWRSAYSQLYKNSFITIEYPYQIPEAFHAVVTQALLRPYNINGQGQSAKCNLYEDTFVLALHPAIWKKPWISLLTYFAKYGHFLEALLDGDGIHGTASIDDTVSVVLDSWSGQVGFYTAFGLWSCYYQDPQAINGFDTANGIQFSGINHAMEVYTNAFCPSKLIEFIQSYDLGLERVSRLYLDNHKDLIEEANLVTPRWYTYGGHGYDNLSDSPEYASYMGWDDDYDGDDDDNYDEEDDYDEEDW